MNLHKMSKNKVINLVISSHSAENLDFFPLTHELRNRLIQVNVLLDDSL